jgi:single-stranded DNA-binding protein
MQMLGSREGSGAPVAAEPSERASTAEPRGPKSGAAPAKKNVDDLDDDIPF